MWISSKRLKELESHSHNVRMYRPIPVEVALEKVMIYLGVYFTSNDEPTLITPAKETGDNKPAGRKKGK